MARHHVPLLLTSDEGDYSRHGVQSTDVFPANGKRFTLEELQGLVGGPIELIRSIADPNFFVVCNEEGLIHDLILNMVASRMTGRDICGSAVVVHEDEL